MAILPATADQKTVDFVVEFCRSNLHCFGLNKVYLFGSRASGNPRSNSDHDFYAVVSDVAPAEVNTGCAIHYRIFSKLLLEKDKASLGKIDLMISRESVFHQQAAMENTHAKAAVARGIVVFHVA